MHKRPLRFHLARCSNRPCPNVFRPGQVPANYLREWVDDGEYRLCPRPLKSARTVRRKHRPTPASARSADTPTGPSSSKSRRRRCIHPQRRGTASRRKALCRHPIRARRRSAGRCTVSLSWWAPCSFLGLSPAGSSSRSLIIGLRRFMPGIARSRGRRRRHWPRK